jgi:uncharacterized OB-fold protein
MNVSFGRVSFSPHTKVGGFAQHLAEGRLMGSRCAGCGFTAFPPRSDCPRCLGERFELHEISGRGTLVTFTKIVAAPEGFAELAPYVLGLVDLEDGGRLLASFGGEVSEAEIRVGMELRVVPRSIEDGEDLRVFYELVPAEAAGDSTT